MSAFDDILEGDAALVADADAFPGVETFKYHRHGKGIKVVSGPVFRDPTTFDPVRMAPAKRLRVWVSREQIPSVDCPGDKVEIAETLGGKVETFTVKEIINQDAGGWELLL